MENTDVQSILNAFRETKKKRAALAMRLQYFERLFARLSFDLSYEQDGSHYVHRPPMEIPEMYPSRDSLQESLVEFKQLTLLTDEAAETLRALGIRVDTSTRPAAEGADGPSGTT